MVLVYLLTITALLMPLGRCADVLGRRRLYLAGFAVYAGGALAAGAAQNVPWLMAARGVQAVGSAAVQGNGLAIALAIFPSEERGKVLGLNALVVAIAASTGPIFSGLLIDSLGWASVLYATGLMAMGALALAFFVLREERIGARGSQGRLDLAGMAISAVAIVTLFLMVSRGQRAGWTSEFTLVAAGIAAVGLLAFVITELRGRDPMIDLRLFTRPRFSLGVGATYLNFVATTGNTFMLPFFLQGVLGYSAAIAGLLTTPFAIWLGIVSPFSGRLSDRIGTRLLTTVGMLIQFGATLGLSRVGTGTGAWQIVLCTSFIGIGMGIFSPPNNSSVLGTVDRSRYGIVASFTNLNRNMGQVSGVAVSTLVITLAVTSLGIQPDIGALRKEGAAVDPLLIQGFVHGMQRMYLITAALIGVGGFLSFLPAHGRASEARQEAGLKLASTGSDRVDTLGEPEGRP